MAIFAKNTTKSSKAATETAVAAKTLVKKEKKVRAKNAASTAAFSKGPSRVLLRPHITEKATYAIEKSTYVFEVAADATKQDVASVIEAVYSVKPKKVNIVRQQARIKISKSRRRVGTESGIKKAYVILKKGDKIELI